MYEGDLILPKMTAAQMLMRSWLFRLMKVGWSSWHFKVPAVSLVLQYTVTIAIIVKLSLTLQNSRTSGALLKQNFQIGFP